MTNKTVMCLFDINIHNSYKDLLLQELSQINLIHIKPKQIEGESQKKGENVVDKIKKLRANTEDLFKALKISDYDLQNLKAKKDERIEFKVKDVDELINFLLEEVDFYSNRVAELERYTAKVKIELNKMKTIEESYKFMEKVNLTRDNLSKLDQLSFRVFITFSKNLINLKNLFEFSKFPNFYETQDISDDRIIFYTIYPVDKEDELKEKVRIIHAEEVPILKKYLLSDGINFNRISSELKLIDNTMDKYQKELERLRDDNILLFAAIHEAVTNIEEYNWAERQFEEITSSRSQLKFFIPAYKKDTIQQRLIEVFKDQITIHSIEISKKPLTISEEEKQELDLHKSTAKKPYKSAEIKSDEEEISEELREETPRIMKNNFFVRPFETLTRMYGTPSYSEIDPTPFLAITFPILFGLMFGDIGHGLVLIIAGVVGALLFRNKKGSDFLNFCWIIFYCGWGAILCGFLYGEFFGMHDIEIGGQILVHLTPIKLSSVIPEPHILLIISGIGAVIFILGGIERLISRTRKRRWIIDLGLTLILLPLILIVLTPVLDITLHNPISNILTVFLFAVLVGVIHINLGWFIQFLNYWRQSRKYLSFSDSLVKILLLTGGTILLFVYGFDINAWLAPPYPILLPLIPGILLIILKPLGKIFHISYLKKESYKELVGEGSMETFETLLSIISNVASYIRLLALALAHIALMIAIQAMAGLVQGEGIFVEIIRLIGLIFGNVVVILIEGLLVFLNALRLNFYEFFFKFYHGSGTQFYPFYLDDNFSIIEFKLKTDKDIIFEEIEKEIESKKTQEDIIKATKYISKKYL
ncbi:MAG: V-type ATPase 116kDa subunit family protein [Promethearchaeota archaeon]